MSREPAERKLVVNARSKPDLFIRTKEFQAVTFFDVNEKRQIIVLYSLGEDGIIREYSNGKWNPYPVR